MELAIIDEAIPGRELGRFVLEVSAERTTLRELIRDRVRQEVEKYNQSIPDVFLGLVQPEASERLLNGYRVKTRRPIDWERQYEAALRSFEGNGFFALANDEPLDSLDAEFVVEPGTEIRFVKLLPLVGG